MNAGSRQAILTNFSALAGTQVIARVLRFLYFIVLARLLGPGDLGVYAYGMGVYLALMGLAGFGQQAILSTHIGHRPRTFPTIAAHSLSVRLIASGVATGLGLGFLILTEAGARVLVPALIFMAVLPARSLMLWAQQCAVALEDARWFPRYELTFRVAEVTAGIAALLAGGGVVAVALVHLASWAIEAAAALRLVGRRAHMHLRPGRDRRLLKRIAARSAVLAVAGLIGGLFLQIGIVGLRLVQPETALIAQFSIAVQVMATALIFPTSLAPVLQPGLSRALRQGNHEDVALMALVVKAALVAGGLAAVVGVAIGPWAITLVFGDAYGPAGKAFAIAVWALGPYSAAMMLGMVLVTLGARGEAVAVAAAMAGVHAGLLVLLMPFGGLFAAAASLVAGATAGAGLGAFFVARHLRFAGRMWWFHPLAITAIVGLAMELGLVPAPWSGVVFGALFVALVLALRVVTLGELRTALARLRPRRAG